jgi:hypothetical protein
MVDGSRGAIRPLACTASSRSTSDFLFAPIQRTLVARHTGQDARRIGCQERYSPSFAISASWLPHTRQIDRRPRTLHPVRRGSREACGREVIRVAIYTTDAEPQPELRLSCGTLCDRELRQRTRWPHFLRINAIAVRSGVHHLGSDASHPSSFSSDRWRPWLHSCVRPVLERS